ncbi:protachykinin [Epinephelus moara]|uniref:protachykinin n=1 Tax=Epinephelus moara TaxID=300413 RepID=UPI00214E891C|nr:protachykinin [Epinephelus moara]
MMELVKVVLVVLLLTNVYCQEMDVDNWRDRVGEDKWPNSGVVQDMLVRLTRKPGPRQYLGLMGKRDYAKTQTARKRHKFQTFVGLMGKRSFEDQGAQ